MVIEKQSQDYQGAAFLLGTEGLNTLDCTGYEFDLGDAIESIEQYQTQYPDITRITCLNYDRVYDDEVDANDIEKYKKQLYDIVETNQKELIDFLQAIKTNDLETLNKEYTDKLHLINHGPVEFETDDSIFEGHTPFTLAARCSKISVLEWFYKVGLENPDLRAGTLRKDAELSGLTAKEMALVQENEKTCAFFEEREAIEIDKQHFKDAGVVQPGELTHLLKYSNRDDVVIRVMDEKKESIETVCRMLKNLKHNPGNVQTLRVIGAERKLSFGYNPVNADTYAYLFSSHNKNKKLVDKLEDCYKFFKENGIDMDKKYKDCQEKFKDFEGGRISCRSDANLLDFFVDFYTLMRIRGKVRAKIADRAKWEYFLETPGSILHAAYVMPEKAKLRRVLPREIQEAIEDILASPNTKINYLNLSGNTVTADMLQSWRNNPALMKNNKLLGLNLANTELTTEGVTEVAGFIKEQAKQTNNSYKLAELNLSRNSCSSIRIGTRIINEKNKLRTLEVSNANLHCSSIGWSDSLKSREQKLTHLDLTGNYNVDSEDVKNIKKEIAKEQNKLIKFFQLLYANDEKVLAKPAKHKNLINHPRVLFDASFSSASQQEGETAEVSVSITGHTPLTFCVFHKLDKAVEYLLKAGLPTMLHFKTGENFPEERDGLNYKTARQIAQLQEDKEMLELLNKYDPEQIQKKAPQLVISKQEQKEEEERELFLAQIKQNEKLFEYFVSLEGTLNRFFQQMNATHGCSGIDHNKLSKGMLPGKFVEKAGKYIPGVGGVAVALGELMQLPGKQKQRAGNKKATKLFSNPNTYNQAVRLIALEMTYAHARDIILLDKKPSKRQLVFNKMYHTVHVSGVEWAGFNAGNALCHKILQGALENERTAIDKYGASRIARALVALDLGKEYECRYIPSVKQASSVEFKEYKERQDLTNVVLRHKTPAQTRQLSLEKTPRDVYSTSYNNDNAWEGKEGEVKRRDEYGTKQKKGKVVLLHAFKPVVKENYPGDLDKKEACYHVAAEMDKNFKNKFSNKVYTLSQLTDKKGMQSEIKVKWNASVEDILMSQYLAYSFKIPFSLSKSQTKKLDTFLKKKLAGNDHTDRPRSTSQNSEDSFEEKKRESPLGSPEQKKTGFFSRLFG